MAEKSISVLIAERSGKFSYQGKYFRPKLDSGIAEAFDHKTDHNEQAFIIHANKPEKTALKIGGSEYSLQELSDKLGFDLDQFTEEKKRDWLSKQSKQHGIETSVDNIKPIYLKYWETHHIKPETLKKFGIIFSTKEHGRGKGFPCFVIPLGIDTHKYFILNEKSQVIDKLTQTGKKNCLFPSYELDDGKDILLCEGFCDCLLLRQLGFNAFTWSGGVTELHKIADQFNNRKIILCIDRDEPSKQRLSYIYKHCLKKGHQTLVIHLPLKKDQGKDFCDFWAHYDLKLFNSLIDTAQPLEEKEVLNEVEEIEYKVKGLILEEIQKLGQFINITKGSEDRDLNQTYFVFYNAKKMLRLFNRESFNKTFNRLIASTSLKRLNAKLLLSGTNGTKGIDKEQLQDLVTASILLEDKRLPILDCQQSNLSILKDDKLRLSTDIDEGIIITQDFQNLRYSTMEPKENQEVEDVFNALLGEKNSLIAQAHIISAIVNESMSSKHVLIIAGSSMLGKSKLAELFSRIITNDFITTDSKKLDKMWKRFFSSRSPVLDNLDQWSSLTPEIIGDLTEIITIDKTNRDVRYSEGGETFICDVYPIVTTILPHLLDRTEANPLKTRAIYLEPERNDFAAKQLPFYCKDSEFIQKARLHFYFLVEAYLSSEKIKDSELSHRAINFFKVLHFLKLSFAETFQKEILTFKSYPPVLEHFLSMVHNKDLTHDYYNAGFWINAFQEHLDDHRTDRSDLDLDYVEEKMKPHLFFRNLVPLAKFTVQGVLGDFIIRTIRKDNKHAYRFERLENQTELPF